MNQDKSRLKDSYRNAKQVEEVLLSRTSFHESVALLRAKWNVPKSGLKDGQLEAWQIWFARQERSYKPTTEDVRVEKERHKRIDKSSMQLIKGFDRLIDNYLDTTHLGARQVFRNDIGSLLQEQNLNPRWYTYLERYILLNKRSQVPSGMQFRTDIDDVSGQEILVLKITEEIRKSDLLAAWPVIKEYQEKLPYYKHSKTQPRRVFKRNKKVAEMKAAGSSIDDIIAYLDTHYPKKVDDVYMKEDILKMISEYNKSL